MSKNFTVKEILDNLKNDFKDLKKAITATEKRGSRELSNAELKEFFKKLIIYGFVIDNDQLTHPKSGVTSVLYVSDVLDYVNGSGKRKKNLFKQFRKLVNAQKEKIEREKKKVQKAKDKLKEIEKGKEKLKKEKAESVAKVLEKAKKESEKQKKEKAASVAKILKQAKKDNEKKDREKAVEKERRAKQQAEQTTKSKSEDMQKRAILNEKEADLQAEQDTLESEIALAETALRIEEGLENLSNTFTQDRPAQAAQLSPLRVLPVKPFLPSAELSPLAQSAQLSSLLVFPKLSPPAAELSPLAQDRPAQAAQSSPLESPPEQKPSGGNLQTQLTALREQATQLRLILLTTNDRARLSQVGSEFEATRRRIEEIETQISAEEAGRQQQERERQKRERKEQQRERQKLEREYEILENQEIERRRIAKQELERQTDLLIKKEREKKVKELKALVSQEIERRGRAKKELERAKKVLERAQKIREYEILENQEIERRRIAKQEIERQTDLLIKKERFLKLTRTRKRLERQDLERKELERERERQKLEREKLERERQELEKGTSSEEFDVDEIERQLDASLADSDESSEVSPPPSPPQAAQLSPLQVSPPFSPLQAAQVSPLKDSPPPSPPQAAQLPPLQVSPPAAELSPLAQAAQLSPLQVFLKPSPPAAELSPLAQDRPAQAAQLSPLEDPPEQSIDTFFDIENQLANILSEEVLKEISESFKLNEAVNAVEKQVDVADVGNDEELTEIFLDIQDEREEELFNADNVDEDILEPDDPTLIQLNNLNDLNDSMDILTAQIKDGEKNKFIIKSIVEIAELYRIVNIFILPSPESPLYSEIKKVIMKIKAFLKKDTDASRRIKLQLRKLELEDKREGIGGLKERLSKVKKAIRLVRNRVQNDGLTTMGGIEAGIDDQTKIVIDAVAELEDDIRINGVGPRNIDYIISILKIVSFDTLDVVRDVLINDPTNIVSLPTSVPGPLLIRLLGRIAYSGTSASEDVMDSNVQGFLTTPDNKMEGRNEPLVSMILKQMRRFLPRPPPVPPSLVPLERELTPPSAVPVKRSLTPQTLRRRKIQKEKASIREAERKAIEKMRSGKADKKSVKEVASSFFSKVRGAMSRSSTSRTTDETILKFLTSPKLGMIVKSRAEAILFLNNMTQDEREAYSDWIKQVVNNPELERYIQNDGGENNPEITMIERLRNGVLSLTKKFKEYVKRLRSRRKRRVSTSAPFNVGVNKDFGSVEQMSSSDDERSLFPGLDQAGIEDAEAVEDFLENPNLELNEELEEQLGSLGKMAQAAASLAAVLGNSAGEKIELFKEYFFSALGKSEDIEMIIETVSEVGVGAASVEITKRVLGIAGADIPVEAVAKGISVGFLGGLATRILLTIASVLYDYYTQTPEERELELEKMFSRGETEGTKAEDKDKPIGDSLLRPEFKMLGTEYFDKQFSITPMDIQNSEWTSFNYVNSVDRQNLIEIDNALSEQIRYSGHMYLPDFIEQPPPPTKESINLMRGDMIDQIQISQEFGAKFDNAFNLHDNLSFVNNRSVVPNRWNKNILYYPDN